MVMFRRLTGDGDACPQDPSHGRMWVTSKRHQWCPSAEHKGSSFYLFDGVTPVHGSTPALGTALSPEGAGRSPDRAENPAERGPRAGSQPHEMRA